MLVESVAEGGHRVGRRCAQVAVGYGVESDEVDAAVKSFEESCESVGVTQAVVDAAPHDVLE